MSILVVCGVSGSGKTTVGRALARRLACGFIEGDDYHPEENIHKMSSGHPLDDTDRKSWVERICQSLDDRSETNIVLACSALTPFVQDALSRRFTDRIIWLKLEISQDIAMERMTKREHFMPPDLLESQFEAWHAPRSGLSIAASRPVDEIVDRIVRFLGTDPIRPDS